MAAPGEEIVRFEDVYKIFGPQPRGRALDLVNAGYGKDEVLRRSGSEFQDVNVLEDPSIRHGIKEFTNWPTIPQLYVRGKFVGGCDIVREMYEKGELDAVLSAKES